MRVLLTVEFFWPRLGGAEEVVRHLAEGLAARGHEVHVATSPEAGRAAGALPGVTIHEFAVTGNEVKRLRGEVERYRRFLREFEADILFNYAAQSWATDVAMQEQGRLAARHTVLATCGYSGLSTPLRRLAYRGYFRRLPARLRRYDLLVYHSGSFRDAEFSRRHGIEHGVVIGNGVDPAEFAGPGGSFRGRVGVGERPLVVNVSNHYRLKGHDRYLALAGALRAEAAFVLIGRGVAPRWQSCAATCESASRRIGARLVEGVRQNVVEALRDADLFVFTSRSEVSPIVLLEAAAAGVPWISFDVGNARELRGGVVVEDAARLEAEARRLLASPSLREELSREGLTFAAGNTWEARVADYEAAFRRLLEGDAAGPRVGPAGGAAL